MLIDSLYTHFALLTQASILAGIILLIFHLRVFLGLAPLYTVIGVLQPIQTILAGTLFFKLSDAIIISPGSTVLFTASLFAVLLVYIHEDALETRKIVYSIVLANVIMTALLVITSHQLTLTDALNPFNISPAIFNQGLRIILVGNVALFCDVILLILAYEWIRRQLKTRLLFSVLATMLIVLAFDTLVFATGAFYSSPNFTQILLSSLVGKGVTALLLAVIFGIYLKVFEERDLAVPQAGESFRDIFATLTYREKYHQELERSQKILRDSDTIRRAILNSTSDSVIAVDHKGTIIEFNRAAENSFGYDRSQVAGKMSSNSLFAQECQHDINNRFVTTLSPRSIKQESGELFNATALRITGVKFPVEIALARVAVSGQSVLVLSLRDISQRIQVETHVKETEARLHQAQKMESVGRLAGGIAHDFNNILSVINGYSEICLRRTGPQHLLYEEIRAILSAGKKAAALTQKLLVFSRHQIINKQFLNATMHLKDLEKILRRLVRSDIEIVIDTEKRLWPVFFDQTQLEQIVLNLVVNACDAMANGGRLTLTTRNLTMKEPELIDDRYIPPGDYVLLSVGDTGHGISDDIRDQIFEPFFTTKPVGQGTGMGLSTVHGIITQNNGLITFRTEPEVGTVFTVFLHRYQDPKQIPASNSNELKELQVGTGTILVVEDDDVVRSFCRDVLENLGYQVMEAGNGEEALETFRNAQIAIDLVLTDIVMPKTKGPTLAEELRTLSPHLPIVFMSGHLEEHAAHLKTLKRTTVFLNKPFSHGELANSVHKLLLSKATEPRTPNRFFPIGEPAALTR